MARHRSIDFKLIRSPYVRLLEERAKGAPSICCAVLLYVKLTQQPYCHLQLSVSELLNGTRAAFLGWEQRIPLTISKGLGWE